MKRLGYCLVCSLAFATLGTTPTAFAQERVDWDRIDLPRERKAIENYQSFDQRLQDVGWAMARGNVEFCEQTVPAVGLQLQDMASYGGPRIARAALSLEGDFAVQTAARGSPAGLSGAFTRNAEIIRIGSQNPNGWEAGARIDWHRLKRAHDYIDAQLEKEGKITFTLGNGTAHSLTPVPICDIRFELSDDGKRAVSVGKRVVISVHFPAFAYSEEVFAGVVAHEVAHSALGHTVWLDRNGRGHANVRDTEREADRLMPWLLANSGYNPENAVDFFETWGPKHDGGLFGTLTRSLAYSAWDERAARVAVEIPKIKALMESEGKADWSKHFTREIDPNQGL